MVNQHFILIQLAISSKLFERIMPSHLLFLESQFILAPRQAGFRPGWSAFDQMILFSHSISDGFNKAKSGSLMMLLLVTRPLPRDGGMVEDHGASEVGQLPRVWTRGRTETESRQRVSGAKSP